MAVTAQGRCLSGDSSSVSKESFSNGFNMNWKSFIAGCLVIAALLGGAWFAIGYGLGAIRSVLDVLEPSTRVLLTVSSIIALLCSAMIASSISSSRRRATQPQRTREP